MNWFLKLLCAAVILVSASAEAQVGSVRSVSDQDGKTYVSRGTACLIAPDRAITCLHVVPPNSRELTVEFDGVLYPGILEAAVVPAEQDILVIRFGHAIPMEPFKVASLAMGEVVTYGGFGSKVDDYLTQEGIVYRRYIGPNGGKLTAVVGHQVRPGDSGGPVMNAQGHLVGVVRAYIKDHPLSVFRELGDLSGPLELGEHLELTDPYRYVSPGKPESFSSR